MIALLVWASFFVVVSGTYNYTEQGADWTNPKWDCLAETSQTQSPVDLQTKTSDVATTSLQLVSIGGYSHFFISQTLNTIRVIPQGKADRLVVDQKDYYLEFYDIRAGSEHTLDGKRSGLEVQVVFQNVISRGHAILSFLYNGIPLANHAPYQYFLEALAENSGLNNMSRMYASSEDNRLDMFSVSINWIVDQHFADLLTYEGTFTSPPCSGPVRWFIYDTALPVPIDIVKTVASFVTYNNTEGNYRLIPKNNQSNIAVAKYTDLFRYGVYLASGAHYLKLQVMSCLLVLVSSLSVLF